MSFLLDDYHADNEITSRSVKRDVTYIVNGMLHCNIPFDGPFILGVTLNHEFPVCRPFFFQPHSLPSLNFRSSRRPQAKHRETRLEVSALERQLLDARDEKAKLQREAEGQKEQHGSLSEQLEARHRATLRDVQTGHQERVHGVIYGAGPEAR